MRRSERGTGSDGGLHNGRSNANRSARHRLHGGVVGDIAYLFLCKDLVQLFWLRFSQIDIRRVHSSFLSDLSEDTRFRWMTIATAVPSVHAENKAYLESLRRLQATDERLRGLDTGELIGRRFRGGICTYIQKRWNSQHLLRSSTIVQ